MSQNAAPKISSRDISVLPATQRRAVFAKMHEKAANIILHGADRGIDHIRTPASFSLHRQASDLLKKRDVNKIAILTGFPIKMPDGRVVFENDGPLGAGMLAAAFSALGWPVTLITDEGAKLIFEEMIAVIDKTTGTKTTSLLLMKKKNLTAERIKKKLVQQGITQLIAIERPGAARDNDYYNMRAEAISSHIVKADTLVTDVPWTTAAYADGGNEIGMGKVGLRSIAKTIEDGYKIASRTKVDFLTLCAVSNWGAYGLIAYLAVGAPKWRPVLLQYLDASFDRKLFNAAKRGGAVDGITKKKTQSVDNLPLATHHQKIEDFRRLIDHYTKH